MQIDVETQLTLLKRRVGDDAVVIGVLNAELAARNAEIERQAIEITALKSAAVDASAPSA